MKFDYDEQYILEAQSVIKNTFAIFIVYLLMPLLNFLLSILIARSLGVSDFGQYSLLLALVFIFQNFQILGLQQYIIKNITPDKTAVHRYVCGISLIGLLLTLIFYICVCFYVNIGTYPADLVKISYIYALTLFSNLGIIIFETLFIAYEKVKYASYAVILGTVSGLVFSFIALQFGYGLNIIMYILTIISYVTLFISICLFTKYVTKIRLTVDFLLIKSMLIKARIFVPIAILVGVLRAIDILILSRISGANVVGLYATGKKLLNLIILVPFSLSMALFPIFSKYYHKSREFFEILFKRALIILSIFILPLSVLMVFLADKLVVVIYGRNFIDAVYSMRILLSSAFFMTLSFIMANTLIIAGRQKYDLIALSTGMSVFVILGIVLSARYGEIGMAGAYLTAMFILFILHYSFSRRYVFEKNFLSIMIKPVLSALAMIIFIYLFKDFNYILVSILSFVVYFIFAWAIKAFTKQDVFLFREIAMSFVNQKGKNL